MAGQAGDMAGQAGDMAGQAGDMAGQAGDMAGQAGDMAGQAGDMAGQAGGMGGGAGVVETFDDHRGYGTIRRLDDGAELFFHCTAIADGSRSIAVGQPVRFHTAPGHLGRTEARGIEKA